MTDDGRKEPGAPVPAGQLRFEWPGAPPAIDDSPAPAPMPTPTAAPSEPSAPVEAAEPILQPDDHEPHEPVPDEGPAYSPRHPWHYYVEGDHASPVPFDAIPASESAGRALAADLPKSPAKRLVKVRELLETERSGLAEAAVRYQDVVERGAEALSNYDRTIAYGGNDELARAATIALLYNQIAWRRGRVSWLEKENARGGGDWLKR